MTERDVVREEIPELSERELARLVRRINPVGRFLPAARGNGLVPSDEGGPYLLKVHDPRRSDFIGRPTPLGRVNGLRKLKEIETRHRIRFRNGDYFGATVAEVLAQIPKEDLDVVVAFETSAEQGVVRREGYVYLTTTTLYVRVN